MIGVIREITRQRQREQALSSSEKRFATLFHLCPNMVLLTRQEDGLITEANQYFESLFGWPVQDAIGRTTLELGLWVNPEQRRHWSKPPRPRANRSTWRCSFAPATARSTTASSAHRVELEGQPYLISTFVDTTERKAAEHALKDSQERLDLALDSAQLGTWDWHIPSGMLYGSARAAQLHGMDAKPFMNRSMRFSKGCRRRTRQHARRLPQPARRPGRQLSTDLPRATGRRHFTLPGKPRPAVPRRKWRAAAHGRHPAGHHRPGRTRATPGASEEKFASLFQVSPDPICVTRQDTGQFIEINSSFTQTFGWGTADVIGRSADEIGLWDASAKSLQRIEQVIREQA
jgi:PAS domain S-box-containing protein